MATGALDANGIWLYGEDDSEPTASALLNKLGNSVSDKFDGGLPIASGGTGATTVAGAQDSLRVGLVPISPSTVTYTGTSATANALGQISISVCSQVTLQNVFTSDYRSYLIIFNAKKDSANANDVINFKLANNGTPTSDTNYNIGAVAWQSSDGSFQNLGGNTVNFMYFARLYMQGSRVSTEMYIHGAATTEATVFDGKHIGTTLNNYQNIIIGGTHGTGTAYDGLQIISPGGATFSGAVQVFGMNR